MHIDRIMCSNTSMLGPTNSKLVKNRQKTQNHTHLKHGCHVWHVQLAGYGHFFQTFTISCGEWVEQVRLLRNVIGAIWKFDKSCTGPPTICLIWMYEVVWGEYQPQTWRCGIISTPQVNLNPQVWGQLGQCNGIKVQPYALETAYQFLKHFVQV